jgi:uncharacterized damage-inducible protein DinB
MTFTVTVKYDIMKTTFSEFASYNLWANRKLTDRILQLPADAANKEIKSSFPSIRKTLLHMLDASSAWYQRIKLQERVVMPSEHFHGSVEELIVELIKMDMQWEQWVQHATTSALLHVFEYRNTKKELFKQPVYQVLLHLFNHNTYHRGQLVTLLRQLDADNIPQTDFVVWTRIKK